MHETKAAVDAQLAALPNLPIKQLWVLWDWYFPRRPENPNRNYLEPRIAHKLQQKAFLDLAA